MDRQWSLGSIRWLVAELRRRLDWVGAKLQLSVLPGARRAQEIRAGMWRNYIPVIVVAILGTAVSIVAWRILSDREAQMAAAEFGRRGNNTALMLQSGLDESLEKLIALRGLFDASETGVTRKEFETFADGILSGQHAILSVSWVPRVIRGERALHEAAARRDGIKDYAIKRLTADNQLQASEARDEYFPVFYATGREAISVYGFDLNDDGPRQNALERARDGNRLSASDPIMLRTGVGDRTGFLVMLPVYQRGLSHNTLDRKRQHLRGYVQAVVQTSVMVNITLRSVEVPLDLFLFAEGQDSGSPALHVRHGTPGFVEEQPSSLAAVASGEHWAGKLRVADRNWPLIAKPLAPNWGLGLGGAWIALAVGLLVTAGVGAFIWASVRNTIRLLGINARMTQLAQTDALTGLANRPAFLDRLEAACANARNRGGAYSILCFDLDHFKDINDTLGHPVGDALLKEVASRLMDIRGKDDIAARFGGDEFAVLQGPWSDPASAGELAQRIVESFADPIIVHGNMVRVTASIGISHFSGAEADPETVMMQADLALYRAKEDGRNCYRFHSRQFEQQVQERVRLGEDLRHAVERSEIALHYQPQVELTSGRIIGLEALVRWTHPTLGPVPPSLFIPIAERTGAIVDLGRWIFDEACRQTRAWHDQGLAPPTVAVNVSMIQLKSLGLDRDIARSLARWRIEPSSIEVELTESVLMEATQQNGDAVAKLRQLGLRIALDDFGTGYSSLSYLTNYPVDRLKIAQQLVFGVPSDSRHVAVVRTAIGLAHELGIQCVAEGVENAAQALFLVAASCRYGQGYCFSPPVTAEQATKLLQRGVLRPFDPSKDLQYTADRAPMIA